VHENSGGEERAPGITSVSVGGQCDFSHASGREAERVAVKMAAVVNAMTVRFKLAARLNSPRQSRPTQLLHARAVENASTIVFAFLDSGRRARCCYVETNNARDIRQLLRDAGNCTIDWHGTANWQCKTR
jgi:hypothetical protein